MKDIRIKTTWYAYTTVEVEDDFVVPSSLNEFPEDILEVLDTTNAEIVDWEEV